MLQKRNYEVRITWETRINDQSILTVVIDTGEGPNLVDKSALPSEWIKRIQPLTNIRLKSAFRQAMNSIGVIPLFVQFGDLKVRVWFGVIEGLAVSPILGTSFIDLLRQDILPAEQ